MTVIIKIPYIPYFPTSRYRVETMVELAKVEGFEKMADLGSGDGRIAIEFAKKGVIVDGFELDEKWVKVSEKNIRDENVTHMVSIQTKDFWDADLSTYDIVAVYPMPDVMEKLEEKLKKELKKGAKALLNYYPLPTWQAAGAKRNIYLYIK